MHRTHTQQYCIRVGIFHAALITLGCAAQTPYCNLFWEANDGSGWTRGQFTTTHNLVNVRYVAEWDVPGGGGYFSGIDFDATINNASLGSV